MQTKISFPSEVIAPIFPTLAVRCSILKPFAHKGSSIVLFEHSEDLHVIINRHKTKTLKNEIFLQKFVIREVERYLKLRFTFLYFIFLFVTIFEKKFIIISIKHV